jgi:hypothetical protein
MQRVDYVVSYTTSEGKPRTRKFWNEEDALTYARTNTTTVRVEKQTIEVVWKPAIQGLGETALGTPPTWSNDQQP